MYPNGNHYCTVAFRKKKKYNKILFSLLATHLHTYNSWSLEAKNSGQLFGRDHTNSILVFWHSLPISSEVGGSLACHTYCDTGYPFICSTLMTCDSHLLPQRSCRNAPNEWNILEWDVKKLLTTCRLRALNHIQHTLPLSYMCVFFFVYTNSQCFDIFVI